VVAEILSLPLRTERCSAAPLQAPMSHGLLQNPLNCVSSHVWTGSNGVAAMHCRAHVFTYFRL
jgi:hypothetical protein